MLQPDQIARIEDLLVEFNDIFVRHRLDRFDIGMNEEFKVTLTTKDNSLAYSQSLPTPFSLKEDIFCRISTFASVWDRNNSPVLQIYQSNIGSAGIQL